MTRRDFGIRVGALPAALPFTAAAAGRGIDQNPIRRKGVGLRGWNRAQASPGLTLFTPMNGEGTVYLMDLNGKIGHTWEMPYPPGLHGYLTERGTLFSNGKIPTDSVLGRTPSKAASHWSGLERPDSLGRREANPHYAGSLLKNGNVRNGMLRDGRRDCSGRSPSQIPGGWLA